MPYSADVMDKPYENESEVVKYQNTYRLESRSPFKIDQVDKIVKTVMINNLDDATYDAAQCPNLCSTIAMEIRKRIEKLNFDRYKIIVVVTIIEKASQSVETSLGFLWDADRDNYSTFSFKAQTFYAYCCVLGVYYE